MFKKRGEKCGERSRKKKSQQVEKERAAEIWECLHLTLSASTPTKHKTQRALKSNRTY